MSQEDAYVVDAFLQQFHALRSMYIVSPSEMEGRVANIRHISAIFAGDIIVGC